MMNNQLNRQPRPTSRGRWALPPRSWALSEIALLPLRLFLGFTFTFAGLQKLANPNFFNAASTSSIQAQLIAATRVSPIGSLVGHLLQFATPLGVIIALGEIAIGVGTLLGLWGRIAAVGGVALSFGLFLTVTFHAAPYYTGADLIYFVAWIPFIISGSGTHFSLDAWISRRAAGTHGRSDLSLVAIPFIEVQARCGNLRGTQCSARGKAPCSENGCPVLVGEVAPITTRRSLDSVDRRTVVVGATVASLVAGGTALLTGATVGISRAMGKVTPAPSSTVTLPTTQHTTSAGTNIGKASSIAVGGSASFTIPSSGDPGIVIRTSDTEYLVYDAVCSHAGCTVGYYPANNLIVCPCHGSEFQVSDGSLLTGPAPTGLQKLKVSVGSDGNLYVS
ncbi:MAG: Rieske 2Fe-2S domain-containing protein [Actinomycetota bacterium]